MAKPIANFSISPNFLSVTFTDKSLNGVDSYLWTFSGSPTPATSTDTNPIITWTTPGQYTVSLQVTNTDGSDTKNVTISISDQVVISLSINQLVDSQLPSGLLIDEVAKVGLIQKWQLYIAPLVIPKVTGSDIFTESAYDSLVNALIADLVTYDLILIAAKQTMVSMQQNTVDPNTKGGAAIKKIETGPSNVEWYNSSDFWGPLLKSGGVADIIKESICQLGARLRIPFPMCPPLVQDTKVPTIQHRPSESSSNYPFGVDPSKYM